MEFIEGRSLATMIESSNTGHLTAAETVDIITQCLAGLSHAHEQKLLHRDIKPANTAKLNWSTLDLPRILRRSRPGLCAGRRSTWPPRYGTKRP
mmetsp:Transcript_61688/g.133996  ORF Transcript_61688/g.133996 Transcript_61688/m.133996 type:complete len:94 (-) Transcript_61688:67-348(-)